MQVPERNTLTKRLTTLLAKSIAFGDFKYYWIADRQGRTFKRLNELYASTGQIGFRVTQRLDGRLVQQEGMKCLAMKAGS